MSPGIKQIKKDTFMMPDKPGVYSISDFNEYKCSEYRFVVHIGIVKVYIDDNNNKIVGYIYNNRSYDINGYPCCFDIEHLKCIEEPHIGKDVYTIHKNDKTLGNITMPRKSIVKIIHYDDRLISYRYDGNIINLSDDIPYSQLLTAIVQRYDTKITYSFYRHRNTIVYYVDDQFYDLKGYLIDCPLEDDLNYLFQITL
jgi:hypothetical protein